MMCMNGKEKHSMSELNMDSIDKHVYPIPRFCNGYIPVSKHEQNIWLSIYYAMLEADMLSWAII